MVVADLLVFIRMLIFLTADFSCGFVAFNFCIFKTVHCNVSSTLVKWKKQSGTLNFWSCYRQIVCLLQLYQVQRFLVLFVPHWMKTSQVRSNQKRQPTHLL